MPFQVEHIPDLETRHPVSPASLAARINAHFYRYVGTLHEINSENSTVALEQVKSYGTEGRSEEEVPASDNVYEYIVFRGSDVKDLRIEKEPERQSQPPQIPDDPAILGVS